SWKSVEMQVALPRTQDAGKLQEQMSKQNQRFQESLAHNQLRQEQLKRKRVNKYEKVEDLKVTEDEKHSSDSDQTEEDKQTKPEKETIEHPYLGSKIDFSG